MPKFAAVRHHVGAAGDGVDGDLIAAGNGHDGLQFRFEKAPVAGFRAGMQVMMGHGGLHFETRGCASVPSLRRYVDVA